MSTPITPRSATFPSWLSLALTLVMVSAASPAAPLAAQQTAAVGGIVVDADSGEPLSGVEVRVDGALGAVTDTEGAFRVADVPRGRRIFTFRHLAYGEHERALVLEGDAQLQYHVRMSREAIELSPLTVEVEPSASSYADEVFRAGGNPGNIIDAGTIEAADRIGLSFMSLLRQEVAGVRVRGGNCLEYRSQGVDIYRYNPVTDMEERVIQNCREMAVYMDGVRMQESASLLMDLYLGQIERVEVLSPGMAGVRYGQAGALGVILIETRQGAMADVAMDRVKVTGFDWHEEKPYGWPRVLGVSFAAYAAPAALAFGTLLDCSEEDRAFQGQTKCNASFATGAALLTGTLGGLLTSWAGRSTLTEGRRVPVLLVGTASAAASYQVLRRSHSEGLDGDAVTGIVLASAATAVLSTLTDRIFRVVR